MAVICVGAEALGRTPSVTEALPLESYGSSHPHFNTQVARIRARVAAVGQLDCIFIGSSQVLYDIDPAVIEAILQSKFNRPFHCQNFGLGGMTPLTAAPLAELLIKDFHPRLLIYGVSELDFIATGLDASDASIVSSPWFRYQLGDFSVDGWLLENSYAYRYYLGTVDYYFNRVTTEPEIQFNGHSVKNATVSTMSLENQAVYFSQFYSRTILRQNHIQGFEHLMALDTQGSALAVLEMPTDPVYLSLNPRLESVYPSFADLLRSTSEVTNRTLWLTQTTTDFAQSDWYDMVHLNNRGSAVLSGIVAGYLSTMYPELQEQVPPRQP